MERKDLKALWENEFSSPLYWEDVKTMALCSGATSIDELREYILNMLPRLEPTHKQKIEALHEEGDYDFMFPAPPVCTVKWTDNDWVDYVDLYGKWYV